MRRPFVRAGLAALLLAAVAATELSYLGGPWQVGVRRTSRRAALPWDLETSRSQVAVCFLHGRIHLVLWKDVPVFVPDAEATGRSAVVFGLGTPTEQFDAYVDFMRRRPNLTSSLHQPPVERFGWEGFAYARRRPWMHDPDRHEVLVVIPAWVVAGLLALPTVAVGVVAGRGRRLSRTGRCGRCGRCGYDLRATPGRCPECGTTG